MSDVVEHVRSRDPGCDLVRSHDELSRALVHVGEGDPTQALHSLEIAQAILRRWQHRELLRRREPGRQFIINGNIIGAERAQVAAARAARMAKSVADGVAETK